MPSTATTGRSGGACARASPRSPPRRRRRTRSCSTSSRPTPRSARRSGMRTRSPVTTSAPSTCREPRSDPGIRARFRQLTDYRHDLELVEPEDGRVEAVIEYLWALPRGESTFVTTIVPELFERRSLVAALARRTELSLKLHLLTEPGVAVTDVPVLARRMNDWRPPQRAVCRILVSGAHAATMRAVNYAGALGFEDRRAVFFAFEADEADRVDREWNERRMPIPLEI